MIPGKTETYRESVWNWMTEESPAKLPFSVLSTSDKVIRIAQCSFVILIGVIGLIGGVVCDGIRFFASKIFPSKEDSQEENWMEEAAGTVIEVVGDVLSWLKPKEMMDESVRLQLGSLLRRLDAMDPKDHKRAHEDIEKTFDQIADQLFQYIQKETADLSRSGAQKFIQTLEKHIVKRIAFNEDRNGIAGYLISKCAVQSGMKRPLMSVAALQGFRKSSAKDNVNQETGWVLDIMSRVNKKLIRIIKNKPDFCNLLLSSQGIVYEESLEGQEEAYETSSDGDSFDDPHFRRLGIDDNEVQKRIRQALFIDDEDEELRGKLAQLRSKLKEIDDELRSLEGVNTDLDDPYVFEDAMPEKAQGLIDPQSFHSILERRKKFLETIKANMEKRREERVTDKDRYQELKQERSQLLLQQIELDEEFARFFMTSMIDGVFMNLVAEQESDSRTQLMQESKNAFIVAQSVLQAEVKAARYQRMQELEWRKSLVDLCSMTEVFINRLQQRPVDKENVPRELEQLLKHLKESIS